MIIYLKNKHTLQVDEFSFKCCIGKNGLSKLKVEGDKKTPTGTFELEQLYFREDRIRRFKSNFKTSKINKFMGWCNDTKSKRYYNKIIKVNKKLTHEKLFRKDHKYDLLIPIKYNYNKTILGKGSCIFIHLTKDYRPTAGCIALEKKDFFIMLKLINKNTKIEIL